MKLRFLFYLTPLSSFLQAIAEAYYPHLSYDVTRKICDPNYKQYKNKRFWRRHEIKSSFSAIFCF